MATTLPTLGSSARGWHWTLWILQGLLGAFFLLAGYGHASMPIGELAKSAPWAADVPVALVRFIGIAEMAGAAGLILPGVTRIAPRLPSMAARRLSPLNLPACLLHLWRSEPFIIQLVVGSAAAVVAWGRAAE